MGEVIQFPFKPKDDWLLIETTIRRLLEEANASVALTERVSERMRLAWQEAKFSCELNLPCEPGVEEQVRDELRRFESELRQYVNNTLFNRLQVEIELALALGL